jgi:hypothetical protein
MNDAISEACSTHRKKKISYTFTDGKSKGREINLKDYK